MSTIDMSFAKDLPPGVRFRNETATIRAVVNATILLLAGCLLVGLSFSAGKEMGDWWVSLFTGLFLFRYLRFVVNCIGYFCYRPAKAPTGRRKFSNKDVSVILPTIDPTGPDFQECIRTCAQNSPKAIFVVTTAGERFETTKKIVEPFRKEFPSTKFKVLESEIANKRRQVAVAIPHVKTALTLMLDDHVFWGPHFLQSAVLPFEDDTVGLVGTNKMARRVPNLGLTARFFNMLGCLYLTRHNFEIRATNAIDGGVFVISARTCIIRTRIITDQQFLDGYKNEMFFFGKYGPLNPDDDNFLTRYVVRQGWRIKVQYTPEACIETTVGIAQPIVTKFLGQCLRWARTTWRSNACSLFTDRSIWSFQPWCVYAVFLSSFTNFAFFVDGGLMGLLLKSSLGSLRFFGVPTPYLLMMWILFTKLVKVLPYFWQYPQDLPFFIGYLGFAYYHSYIKVKSLFTFWDCQWTGRNLKDDKTAKPETKETVTKETQTSPKTSPSAQNGTEAGKKTAGDTDFSYRRQFELIDQVEQTANEIRENLKTGLRANLFMQDRLDEVLPQLEELADQTRIFSEHQQHLNERLYKAAAHAHQARTSGPGRVATANFAASLANEVRELHDKLAAPVDGQGDQPLTEALSRQRSKRRQAVSAPVPPKDYTTMPMGPLLELARAGPHRPRPDQVSEKQAGKAPERQRPARTASGSSGSATPRRFSLASIPEMSPNPGASQQKPTDSRSAGSDTTPRASASSASRVPPPAPGSTSRPPTTGGWI